MMKLRLLLLCLFSLLIVSCSHNVPLRQGFELTDPPNPKYDKKVLLVMPTDQAELVINHKPDPMADTYVFAGGPALKATLLNVLEQLFREVSYATNYTGNNAGYDLVVEVDFHYWDIVLSIYTGNVVTLGVDYTVHEVQRKEPVRIATKTSSKDEYSGGDRAKAFIIGAFYNIGKMKESSGTAWDQATVNSIGKLLDQLLEITQAEGS